MTTTLPQDVYGHVPSGTPRSHAEVQQPDRSRTALKPEIRKRIDRTDSKPVFSEVDFHLAILPLMSCDVAQLNLSPLRGILLSRLDESPLAALAWVRSLDSEEQRAAMTLLLGIEWAKRDFDEALSWAKECDDAAVVATLLGGSLAGNRDITPSVESWLQRQPEWRDLKADGLLGALARNAQYSSAVLIAASMPDSPVMGRLASMLGASAATDPAQALQLASELPDGLRSQAVSEIITNWSAGQADELAEYGLSLPDSPLRTLSLQTAMQKMFDEDPAGLAEWLNAHPDLGPVHDSAAALLAQNAADRDLPLSVAAQWSGAIKNPARRIETILQVARGLQDCDSAAALRYIDSSAGPSPSERLQMSQELLLRPP